MQKRTKFDQRLAKKIASLIYWAIKVTQTTQHDIFISYRAHTNSLEYHFFVCGWTREVLRPTIAQDVSLRSSNPTFRIDSLIKHCKELIESSTERRCNGK